MSKYKSTRINKQERRKKRKLKELEKHKKASKKAIKRESEGILRERPIQAHSVRSSTPDTKFNLSAFNIQVSKPLTVTSNKNTTPVVFDRSAWGVKHGT